MTRCSCRSFLVLGASALALVGCASGLVGAPVRENPAVILPSPHGASADESAMRIYGDAQEELLGAPPAGYTLASRHRDAETEEIQWAPAGQGPKNWSEMTTLKVFKRVNGNAVKFSSEKVTSRLQALFTKGCRVARSTSPIWGQMNAYPTRTWRTTCTASQKGGATENLRFLVILGERNLYVIEMAVKSIPSPEWSAESDAYFKSLMLCNPSSHVHPCPRS